MLPENENGKSSPKLFISQSMFWKSKLFDLDQKRKLSSEKLFLVQSKKFWHSLNATEIGFPKHQLGFQNIRSFIIVMPLIFLKESQSELEQGVVASQL